ncbi:hypothetical protein [Nocardioides humi]|uniref:DUF3558 domain-containing protein n=1 Tax=Nocardioides humi TaxID=449461 RepID=A0ABN2A9P9_9ACTN|nr:hypothetical protein [Nocardioides humi]
MPDLRRTTPVAALLPALTLLLAACGGEEVGAKPELPTETPALWNPCDALDAAFVKEQFGVDATEHAGTPTKPECRFTPVDSASGEAVVTSNYLLFPGSLEDAWKTMGQQPDADVRTPEIAGADDARVVVSATDEQLYVTGFVQNGDLIQQVDVVDPAPYDDGRIVRGVEATLTLLSAHASDSGVGS